MSNVALDGNVTDQNGAAVPGALVYVYDKPGGLTSLADSLGQPVTNPVTAGEDGYWATYVATDRYYTLKYYWGGRERLIEANVLAGTEPPLGGNSDPNLRGDLAAGGGSSLVGFLPSGTGAITRTAQSKLREALSVFDYIPVTLHTAISDRTTTTDVTAYINAAITAAKTTAYAERKLVFPAGRYRVSKVALRDCNYLTLHAEGTVELYGIDGTQGYIIGDNRFDAFGHTENFTTHLRMTGGPWLVTALPGQNYARGALFQNFTDCHIENLQPTGVYTPTGGTGDRIAMELQLSFDNLFLNLQPGYPGAPIGSGKSYGLWLGGDSVNGNRFIGGRGVGGGPTVANTIGVRVDSTSNVFLGYDISSIHTQFELNAARGCYFISGYGEAISRVCNVIFASRGCVFMPGYIGIVANGTAYDFSGGTDVQTIGFQVIGGNHGFTGAGTTFLKKGANCYGLTFQPGLDLAALPATYVTGTDVGSGGSTLLDMFETSAAKINFPDTPIPSSNPTTFDCYKEQDVAIGISVGGTTQTVTSSVKVTKIGRLVTLTGHVDMAAAVSGTGIVSLTNLPYTAAVASTCAPSFSAATYTGTPSAYVETGGTAIRLFQTTEAGVRSQLTEANLTATSEIVFSLTYTATA